MSEHYFEKEYLENLFGEISRNKKTLGDVDKEHVFDKTINNPKITGIAGDVIEQSVLGYPANTKQEPDLNVSGVLTELKTTGIKITKGNNKYEAKEPVSITAVSPEKIVNEEFDTSTFWDKAEHMLFVYYLYDSETTVKASDYANFPIIGYQFHEFSISEKKALRNDWEVVRDFIKKVNDNKLNKKEEYPKISKLRDKCLMIDTAPKFPNSPRFRLKRSVVSNIYQKKYGTSLEELPKEYSSFYDIDKECHYLAKQFKGKTISELAYMPEFNINDDLNNKSICEKIVVKMFGGNSKRFSDVDIFNKFGIIAKTIVMTKGGNPTEQMKLFRIDFDEIIDENIEFYESSFRDYFSQRQFLCIIFEEPSHDAPLKDNVFIGFKRISFDEDFIEKSVKPVWNKIRDLVNNNKLVDVIEKDKFANPIINKTGVISSAPNFPKQSDGEVFVRGSAIDSKNKNLIINGIMMYPQYIWIKGKYICSQLENQSFI